MKRCPMCVGYTMPQSNFGEVHTLGKKGGIEFVNEPNSGLHSGNDQKIYDQRGVEVVAVFKK